MNRRTPFILMLAALGTFLAAGCLEMQHTQSSFTSAESPVVSSLPFHALAPTPPMGWNSWDCWGTGVTEEQTQANADYMAAHLLKHGWKYIVVDIQWYEPKASTLNYRANAELIMDAYGRLLPAVNRFPSSADGKGFKPLSDYVHGKGLEFGIHLLRGIPRTAVEKNLPIFGTHYHAADIANKNDICPWNPDMYGVDMTKPGAQDYYNSVFALIASWGVDFVKVDDLSRPYFDHIREIEAIRSAIAICGRPMVLSTSPGETPLSAGEHVAAHANMWRISDDFWDDWKPLYEQFYRLAKWAPYCGPGHYPDADMIPFGRIRAWEKGWTKFTKNEQITLMTLWAIAQSPLIFGGHLPDNDAFTLSLLTNDDVLAVNQTGRDARQVKRADPIVIWTSHAATDGPHHGGTYVAVFNVGDQDLPATEIPLREIGVSGETVRDLWTHQEMSITGGTIRTPLAAHGAVLYCVK